jgi:ABC-type transport system substrate-binding protein
VGTLFHPDRPYGYFASEHPERYFFAAPPSPELDDLIVQGRNELDVNKARAIYTTIQQKYAEDQGVPQFIVNQPLIHTYREYVQGYGAYGMDFVSLNAAMGLHRTWLAK